MCVSAQGQAARAKAAGIDPGQEVDAWVEIVDMLETLVVQVKLAHPTFNTDRPI